MAEKQSKDLKEFWLDGLKPLQNLIMKSSTALEDCIVMQTVSQGLFVNNVGENLSHTLD